MEYFNFELVNCTSIEEFNLNFEILRNKIKDNNGEVIFELVESVDKNFNEYFGKYNRYNIVKDQKILCVLNTFYDYQKCFANLFTNPIN